MFDGNNIMVTNKIFRNYFLSQQAEENLEGQVRLQWLLGETLTAELFFDTKFDDYLYEGIRESILSP